MEVGVINEIKSIKSVNTRHGERAIAEMSISGQELKEYWLTPKQAEKLQNCVDEVGKTPNSKGEIHAVVDDGRFVWAGMHKERYSELGFLKEKFGVNPEPMYVGKEQTAEQPRVVDDTMRIAVINEVKSSKTVETERGERTIVEMNVDNEVQQKFWLSPKQAEKLEKCVKEVGETPSEKGEIHVVLQGDKFVWAGTHKENYSELGFLKEKFGVEPEPKHVKNDTWDKPKEQTAKAEKEVAAPEIDEQDVPDIDEPDAQIDVPEVDEPEIDDPEQSDMVL